MTAQTSLDYCRRPSEQTLSELVYRIVEFVQPLRVILFGSAACGEMGPDSDLDALVVMPDGVHRRLFIAACGDSVYPKILLWSPSATS